MIKIEDRTVTAEGSAETLLSELAQMVSNITEKLSDSMPVSQEYLKQSIWDSMRYNDLIKTGMSPKEAFNLIKPEMEFEVDPSINVNKKNKKKGK